MKNISDDIQELQLVKKKQYNKRKHEKLCNG